MSFYSQLFLWTVKPAPIRFVWGLAITLAAAILILRDWGEKGLSVLALSLQLAGILITLWQVLDQRKELQIESFFDLYRKWWNARPTRKPRIGSVVGAELTGDYVISSANLQVVRSGSMEEQVDLLWKHFDSLNEKLTSVETTVFRHKSEARREVTEIREKLDGKIDILDAKVKKVIGSGHLLALFGLWMVVLSTAIQIIITLCWVG